MIVTSYNQWPMTAGVCHGSPGYKAFGFSTVIFFTISMQMDKVVKKSKFLTQVNLSPVDSVIVKFASQNKNLAGTCCKLSTCIFVNWSVNWIIFQNSSLFNLFIDFIFGWTVSMVTLALTFSPKSFQDYPGVWTLKITGYWYFEVLQEVNLHG